jgi:hypothetical protein
VLAYRGRIAQVYYSSWCGGHTEAPSNAWHGARDAAYLRAKADSACADEAPWSTEIAEPELRRVLEAAGLRGDGVSEFRVASRYPSGRAAQLRVAGMFPERLDARTFRTAAGRLLGWQTVKSTLFEVRRTGTGYTLTGRGSGHGVGLCVRGAMNRAREGAGRDEILAAYFPGLTVSAVRAGAAAGSLPSARASTIRVTLPESERSHLGATRKLAAGVVRDVAAHLGLPEPADVELVFHPTVEAYTRATGQPWWTAGRTIGTRIDLLPRAVLLGRDILESTLRHEFTHVLADATLAGRPLWVHEGLAVYVAGESEAAASQRPTPLRAESHPCPSDDALRSAVSAEAWRKAYLEAGACVARALAAGMRWQELR